MKEYDAIPTGDGGKVKGYARAIMNTGERKKREKKTGARKGKGDWIDGETE